MYKIYKSEDQYAAYYMLCDESMTVIKWFYVIENIYMSSILHHNVTVKLSSSKECIYRSSDFQEASDQLEQLRILESV